MRKLALVVLCLTWSIQLHAGEIQQAAAAGDLASVKRLVEGTPTLVNNRDRGTTPLHEAARAGQLEVVRYLLAHGANPNTNDLHGTTALAVALGFHRDAVAQLLREHGALEKLTASRPAVVSTPPQTSAPAPAPPDSPALSATPTPTPAPAPRVPTPVPATRTTNAAAKPSVATPAVASATTQPSNSAPSVREMLPVLYPIHEAAKVGDVDQIKFLFKSFPDLIESTDEKGQTPLHIAALNRQARTVEALLGLRAKVNARTELGQTPLHLAARNADARIAGLLLTNGANVNARDTFDRTPLLSATQPIEKDDLEGLNEKAAREKFRSPQRLAQRAAQQQEQTTLVSLLLARGADPNARNRLGGTPLAQAVWLLNDNIVEMLLRAGADPNAPDPSTLVTPLHVAAGRGATNIVLQLLNARAAVNAQDARGETPVGYALHQGNPSVAELLKQRGGTIGTPRQLTAIEQSLVDFFKKTDAALQSASPGEKARIIIGMSPSKADVEKMFPQHAKIAWTVVQQMQREVKETFSKPLADADQGKPIWRVTPEPPTALTRDWRERGWLNRELPVYALTVDRVGSTSRPGDHCYVNQHWVLVPPLKTVLALAKAQQK